MTECMETSELVDEPVVGVEPAAASAPRTGSPAVDGVIDAVAALDDQSLSEHVQVFEQAHDLLRRALDSTADQG